MREIVFTTSLGGQRYIRDIEEAERATEPSCFANYLLVDIYLTDDKDEEDLIDERYSENEHLTKIGFIEARLCELSKAINAGYTPFDFADAIDADIANSFGEIVDSDGHVDDKFMPICSNNALYIDQFYIYKDYRDKGYGLRIMKSIDRTIDYLLPIEYGLVFFYCSPIDYNETVNKKNEICCSGFHNDTEIHDADIKNKRLRKFYKKAGFLPTCRDSKVFYKRMPE